MKRIINEHELYDAQQLAALQLHTEIEEKYKIKFDNFTFEIDEKKATYYSYTEPSGTAVAERTVRLFLQNDEIEREFIGSFAEEMYTRYLTLVNEYLNKDVCICESLL